MVMYRIYLEVIILSFETPSDEVSLIKTRKLCDLVGIFGSLNLAHRASPTPKC